MLKEFQELMDDLLELCSVSQEELDLIDQVEVAIKFYEAHSGT